MDQEHFKGQLREDPDPRYGLEAGDYVTGEFTFMNGNRYVPVVNL